MAQLNDPKAVLTARALSANNTSLQ